MSWIKYLLEANLYMALFYAAYYLLLRRDTHYQLNRAYLLAATLLAFAIPFLQLGILKPTMQVIEPIITTQAEPTTGMPDYPIIINDGAASVKTAEPINYYLWTYILVGVVMTIGLIYRIAQLIKLAKKGRTERTGNISLIRLDGDDHAFSFFNYLFISHKLASSATIIQHEMVHIRQKHSWDIMYIELIKIICWFNPAVYFIQHSLKELHEYIVDRAIASEKDDVDRYTDFLIRNAYGLPAIAPANNFFTKNLLKNRIMMLHQKRSGSLTTLKYLVAVPLTTGMLCLSTLGFTKDYDVYDIAPKPANVTDNGPIAPELTTADPQQTKKDTLPKPPKPPKPKVDVVRFPPPPPPKVDVVRFPRPAITLQQPYRLLRAFMQHNAKYPKLAAENKVGGSVSLYFNLDASGMISGIKVGQGVGSGLDEEATRLLKAYPKPIADKAGQHVIAINFVAEGKLATVMATPATKALPGFIGEVMIYAIGFPPSLVRPDATKKNGTVVIRGLNQPTMIAGVNGSSFLQPTSPLYVVDGVVVTPQNASSLGLKPDDGSAASPLSQIPQEDIASMEILKDAAATSMYGAAGRYGVIKLTTHDGAMKKKALNNKVDQTMLNDFYKYLESSIKYPSAARENNVQGKVFIVFNVNSNNKVTNYKILRGLSDEVNAEAARALKNWTAPEGFPKDVSFTLPLSFNISTNDGEMPPPVNAKYENKAPEPEYLSKNFTQYSLNEVVIRSYIRRTQ